MALTPGSQDKQPPKLLYPDSYTYCIVFRPDGHFEVYRGDHKTSVPDLVKRLRNVLNYFQATT